MGEPPDKKLYGDDAWPASAVVAFRATVRSNEIVAPPSGEAATVDFPSVSLVMATEPRGGRFLTHTLLEGL